MKSFVKLYHQYKEYVRFLVRTRIRKTCDVDDLVQDVFIKIWEYRFRYDHNKSIKNFIYKVTVNTVYNYNNHESVVNKYRSYLVDHQSPSAYTPDSYLYLNEINSNIEKVVNNCPAKQKEVFSLFWYDGLSIEQIAQKKGISLRTADNQIYRTRRKLKEELSAIG